MVITKIEDFRGPKNALHFQGCLVRFQAFQRLILPAICENQRFARKPAVPAIENEMMHYKSGRSSGVIISIILSKISASVSDDSLLDE